MITKNALSVMHQLTPEPLHPEPQAAETLNCCADSDSALRRPDLQNIERLIHRLL
jgi:hypothetical protein